MSNMLLFITTRGNESIEKLSTVSDQRKAEQNIIQVIVMKKNITCQPANKAH